jgi:hypothetical protein
VKRVKEWRAANPGYRAKQKQRRQVRVTLERVLAPELAAAIESCGLQDLNERQIALILGLIARVSGIGLQYQMAGSLRRLMFDGYAVLRAAEPR